MYVVAGNTLCQLLDIRIFAALVCPIEHKGCENKAF